MTLFTPGDWISIPSIDGDKLRVLVAIDGDRAVGVDLHNGLRGGWIDLSAHICAPMTQDQIARAVDRFTDAANRDDAAAARLEEQARSLRRNAERTRQVVEHAQCLAHIAKAGPR